MKPCFQYFLIMQLDDYIFYPALITGNDADGYNVEIFHQPFSENLPFSNDWITCGYDLDDAIIMGRDAIIGWAEEFISHRAPVPARADHKEGCQDIALPTHTALKIMLRNVMLEENIRMTDLAAYAHMSLQNLNKALNLRKKTHIDTLALLFKAAGHPLKIGC